MKKVDSRGNSIINQIFFQISISRRSPLHTRPERTFVRSRKHYELFAPGIDLCTLEILLEVPNLRPDLIVAPLFSVAHFPQLIVANLPAIQIQHAAVLALRICNFFFTSKRFFRHSFLEQQWQHRFVYSGLIETW